MAQDEIPPGTLGMLILQTLAAGVERHGFEIARSIELRSREVLAVEEGSLYPALQRLLREGWVRARWDTTADNRRARYYRLTAAGERRLAAERLRYARVSQAIGRILEA